MKISGLMVLGMLTAGLGWSAAARGDLIELRNGMKVSGTIKREGGGMMITTELGVKMPVERDDVMRVTLLPRMTAMEVAEADWRTASVRIKKAGTIEEAIGICRKFVSDHPKNAEPMQKVLEDYQKLAGEDAVNYRGQWMARGLMELKKQADAEKARNALDWYREGQAQMALKAAQKVIKEDGENPAALDVAGLAAYRINAPNTAIEYFRRAAEADRGDILALNDAAVVSYQQGQQMAGLGYYGKALAAGAENRMVLDNVVEAMHDYCGARLGPVYMNAAILMDQAERPMQVAMAKAGLVRYGSRWLDAKTAGRLASEKQGILNGMAALDGQYQGALAAELADERALLVALTNSTGGVPGPYYGENVQEARLQLQAVVGNMRAEAEQLKMELAEAQKQEFPGVQLMLEMGEARR